ncbi:MAG: AbrB/MazE/SpoVT family DNA-binding domain-containing protein [Pirellulales bacterium]|nr:AbrB/MazE/SpoVT family DNA-binding domain-containing protein [Pirellulales bacterium]
MSTVTISPDFHVELPPDVRQSLNLQPGQELSIFSFNGRIAIVPLCPLEEMRGFLKGMDSDVERDDEERV